jgi:methionyl-tRNA formyltransferase
MRAVFMGKHKRSAVRALEHLVETGWEVPVVVAPEPDGLARPEQRLDQAAERLGLTLAGVGEVYDRLGSGEEVDVVVSFLFWERIREPLISAPGIGCLNFHPAPLPDIRGLGGYNVAIAEGMPEWGVSAHFVDAGFDTGDLVAVERFPIDPDAETAYSLDVKSQQRLYEVFAAVMDRALGGEELPRAPQGEGRYVSREEFEELRRIKPGDDIERKVRAFWYPPHPGATVEVDGRELTVVEERLLRELAKLQRQGGALP